jgi:hypothetical protein
MDNTKIPQKTNGNADDLLANQQTSDLDINQYRVDQNFNLHVQARKKAVCVPVEKPNRQQWVCIHPDPAWRMAAIVLEDKENRRTYIVEPSIAPDVAEDLAHKLLVAYVTRAGNPGLWPIKLQDEGGRIDTYSESALAIVTDHAGKWIRVLSDQNDKTYNVLESSSMELSALKWPEAGFEWMFQTAFRNRVIRSLEHPILKALRGGM